MRNLIRYLKGIFNHKIVVFIIAISSLLITLVISKYIKDVPDESAFFYKEVMENKKAVTILVNASDTPFELFYPGVRVDVVDKKEDEIVYLVEDVYVLSINILNTNNLAKITLALSDEESEKILSVDHFNIRVLISGEGKVLSDIEIVEL